MYLKKASFEIWGKNHEKYHKDAMFRELYPYYVFRHIDFDLKKINVEQVILNNFIKYTATVIKIELQENDRYRATLQLKTQPLSEYHKWNKISWNLAFQIIYTPDGDFITVFTKKRDPSKDYVEHFFKGRFELITRDKSLPISDLLFRTLILFLCEEVLGNNGHNIEFDTVQNGIRPFKMHPQFMPKHKSFIPLFSIDREVWVTHSFSEEKAHRIAFYIGRQCKKLYVIYCNPTYTPHHRCLDANTHVVSLHQFVNELSQSSQSRYFSQITFLQNHLNEVDVIDYDTLIKEINSPSKEFYLIPKSAVLEALSVIKIIPATIPEIFHIVCAMNLINAWIGSSRKSENKNIERKFRDMYFFKTYLSALVSHLIMCQNTSIQVYVAGELVMIKIRGFEFSFHNVPKNDIMKTYESSNLNTEIIWSQKRLQPIAILLFQLAKLERVNVL